MIEEIQEGAPAGLLPIDKPTGPTSHDVVDRVRRAVRVRKVGHFGTLDPFASGLLVCGIGPATRLAPFCIEHDKEYRVEFRLGARSTTGDSEGDITLTDVEAPDMEAVRAACRGWVGTVDQVPPDFSAKKIEGERAYARARSGKPVELPPSRVTIDRIEIVRYEWPDLELVVGCGPGTYLRSLARDVGEDLGVGGYCSSLRRTRSGPFRVESAIRWDDLDRESIVREAMLPSETAVDDLPVVSLDAVKAIAVAHGGVVSLVESPTPAGPVRLSGPEGFIGIGEVRETSEGAVIQPRKILFPAGERSEVSREAR